MIVPVIENDVVIAMRHNIFVKYVTSILEDPCSNTLSWKLGKKASATTLMQTSPMPRMAEYQQMRFEEFYRIFEYVE